MDTPVHHPSVQINYFFSHSRRFLDIFVANYSGNHQSTILSKGNQVPYLEFERPNGKISESKKFLTSLRSRIDASSSLESDFFEDLTRIKTNQKK